MRIRKKDERKEGDQEEYPVWVVVTSLQFYEG